MAFPTREQLEHWAENYVTLWNAGDKEGWLDNWRTVAPGKYTMWDPVGTPPKYGLEHCAGASFDLFQPTITFHVPKETLFFCGNEVGWVMQNHFEKNGRKTYGNSIETYQFGDDGSVVIRTYYIVPSHSDKALGDIFQQYLPENEEGNG